MRMLFEGGIIFGEVPFTLLHLSKGTRSLGSARYHYNLLHHVSFVSDLYFNAHIAINAGGVILNRVPLVNKLRAREIISFIEKIWI